MHITNRPLFRIRRLIRRNLRLHNSRVFAAQCFEAWPVLMDKPCGTPTSQLRIPSAQTSEGATHSDRHELLS